MAMNSDIRKEQIRNSNREAARRCRERRRNYIETLESKLQTLESKNEALIVISFFISYLTLFQSANEKKIFFSALT